MTSESFPCIICGIKLYRENEDYIAQPRNGVVCSTHGNYGSTAYDPLDGTSLVFNICDPCLRMTRDNKMLFERRHALPVKVQDRSEYRASIWGWKKFDGDFVLWTNEYDETDPPFETLTLAQVREVASDPNYTWNAGSTERLLEWVEFAEGQKEEEHGS